MVVEIFNANVTYSVKQLTADCVDETSVHHGFNVDNDYNIRFRTVYKVAVFEPGIEKGETHVSPS